MPLSTQQVDALKVALATDGADNVRQRLDETLGAQNGWLEEGDSFLEEALGGRLTESDESDLERLLGNPDEKDTGDIITILERLADSWESESKETEEEQQSGTQITNVSRVEGQPDWWQGYDESSSRYRYVRSEREPDESTPGWCDQDEAFAAMGAASQAEVGGQRFVNISAVNGRLGWWQAYDTTEPDTDGGYKYQRSEGEPSGQDEGWLSQKDAFAAMQEDDAKQPADAQEDAPAAAPPEPAEAASVASGQALAAAIAAVPGAEALTASELQQILEDAIRSRTAP